MLKSFLVLMMVVGLAFGANLQKPLYVYKVESGLVSDILYTKGKLYIATDDGDIEIFDTATHKKLKTLTLEKVKDFMGDEVESKIFSLDMVDGTLMILSQDSGGYSRVHLYKDEKLTEVISKENAYNVIKAKFIDKNRLVMALISNDVICYNLQTKKQEWDTQASMSKFSNFALNEARTQMAVVDESGEVHIIALKDGKKLHTLSGENVDNIFSVDFRNGVVVTGGQDRRVGVYNLNNSMKYHKMASFFVYGVGLSPSGKVAAYSCDMDNNVELFSTQTRESLGKFQGTKMVVNSVNFLNEKEFFINSSAHSVGYYKLK